MRLLSTVVVLLPPTIPASPNRAGSGLQCTPASIFHQKCLYERHVVIRNDSAAAVLNGAGAAAAAVGGAAVDSDADVGAEYSVRVEGPRGLLPAEFEVYRRLLPEREGEPGPHNTVHLQVGGRG